MAEACKAAVFLLQAKLYAEQGIYCRRRSDLEQHLTGQDLELLQTAGGPESRGVPGGPDSPHGPAVSWWGHVIGQQKAI